ncbi:MAG: PqqD family protein [Armatimonadetes bacterium]|nr:PqqD family protein [Armatimonadota bacterium]MDW8028107.1 PqqD family protein [Armatimonadota bacterium]
MPLWPNSLRLRKRSGVVAKWESSEAILLVHPESREVHVINEAALIVWWLCDGNRNLGQVYAEIEKHFVVDEETRAAIDKLIGELLAVGLLEVVEGDIE